MYVYVYVSSCVRMYYALFVYVHVRTCVCVCMYSCNYHFLELYSLFLKWLLIEYFTRNQIAKFAKFNARQIFLPYCT